MKRKINIGVIDTSLSLSEMRKIMAGSGPGAPGGGGSGGGQECNCLYCELQNGGLEMFYSSGCDDPPNWACRYYTGDWFATGSYGIC